jgi:hypothetical protein
MRGGRLIALLLGAALLMAVGTALVMKGQKQRWRAAHPSPVQPLR